MGEDSLIYKCKYIMHKSSRLGHSVLYNNAAHPVICQGHHLTRMQKNTCMIAHFLIWQVWAHKTTLTMPLFIEVPVPSQ